MPLDLILKCGVGATDCPVKLISSYIYYKKPHWYVGLALVLISFTVITKAKKGVQKMDL